jgi:hypothetical protein
MALTENRDVPLGTRVPTRLPTVDGKTVARDDVDGAAALVVMFICNHCPYVQAVDALAGEYGPREIRLRRHCANDATDYPDDAPAALARWREKDWLSYGIDVVARGGARLRGGLHAGVLRLRRPGVSRITGALRLVNDPRRSRGGALPH